MNAVIADAVTTIGCRRVVEARDLFGRDDILDTFPELDHYSDRGFANYVGPIVSIPAALDVDWQRPSSKKVVAYLRPSVPGFLQIMRGLADLEAETICVVPGLDASLAKRLATSRMRVARVPLNLTRVLPSADLAVGYGTGGFSTQALLAGVPIMMSPKYAEQAILARRISDLGAGRIIRTSDGLASVSEQLVDALFSDEMHATAAAFRDRHRDFSTERALEQSIEIVERAVLGGSKPVSFPQENQTNRGHPSCRH
ncbi:MAG: glycosyltransferase [Aquabacterium sp.]